MFKRTSIVFLLTLILTLSGCAANDGYDSETGTVVKNTGAGISDNLENHDGLYLFGDRLTDADGNTVIADVEGVSRLIYEKTTGKIAYAAVENTEEERTADEGLGICRVYDIFGNLTQARMNYCACTCFSGLYFNNATDDYKIHSIDDIETGETVYGDVKNWITDENRAVILSGSTLYIIGPDREAVKTIDNVAGLDIWSSIDDAEKIGYCLLTFEDGSRYVIDSDGQTVLPSDRMEELKECSVCDKYIIGSDGQSDFMAVDLETGETVMKTSRGEILRVFSGFAVVELSDGAYELVSFDDTPISDEYRAIHEFSPIDDSGVGRCRYFGGEGGAELVIGFRAYGKRDILDSNGSIIFTLDGSQVAGMAGIGRIYLYDAGSQAGFIYKTDGTLIARFDNCIAMEEYYNSFYASYSYLVISRPDDADAITYTITYTLADTYGNVIYEGADQIDSCDGYRAVVEKDGRRMLIDMTGNVVCSEYIQKVLYENRDDPCCFLSARLLMSCGYVSACENKIARIQAVQKDLGVPIINQ